MEGAKMNSDTRWMQRFSNYKKAREQRVRALLLTKYSL
jgi:hypothetical protein